MSLANNFDAKVRMIKDIYNKMSPDELEMLLKMAIKDQIKMYFDVIRSEQRRLEKESGIEGVAEYVEFVDGEEVSREKFGFDNIDDGNKEDVIGTSIENFGKASKEAENVYYCDEKFSNFGSIDGVEGVVDKKEDKNKKMDGFLGYVDAKKNDGKEF